jgi:hypothetical protein
MEIRCRRCRRIEEHSVKPSGRPHVWCKKCQREYSREHYQQNKTAHNRRRYRNTYGSRQAIRTRLNALKNNPCEDCGVTYPPYVMHFDHLRDKRFSISDALSTGQSWSLIEVELEKCDLVCANCHAERTHQRVAQQQSTGFGNQGP